MSFERQKIIEDGTNKLKISVRRKIYEKKKNDFVDFLRYDGGVRLDWRFKFFTIFIFPLFCFISFGSSWEFL